jgi:quinoprotein glucose dehydrogenase
VPRRRRLCSPPRVLAVLLVALLASCSDRGSERSATDAPSGGREQFDALGTEGGQWRHHGGEPQGTKYSPLAQIDAGNFSALEIVWAWETPDRRWREDLLAKIQSQTPLPYLVPGGVVIAAFQATPLMIDGVLYGSSSTGQVFALDAVSGREIWVHDPGSYKTSHAVFDFFVPKHRGVSYWRDGDDERILIPTIDAFLLALDARTGRPVESFGDGGRVDLLVGLRNAQNVRRHEYFQSSPGALYRDTLVVGSSINDRPKRLRAVPGDIRGYDVRTGALKWTFHVVPAEGEPGTETWENETWRLNGAANVWGPMTVDPELGYVYAPTSSATNDFYGGHRLGDNLYAESLLCLNAETGEIVWHQQLIRHGLWDYDVSAPPNLIDIVVDGTPVRAVAEVTKQAFVFVFDRVTGEPVWPIEDRSVPPSDVPGERAAATQRFPTKPPAFDRQGLFEQDLIDFTPELREQALAIFNRYRTGPMFTPPSLTGTLTLPAPSGGANWRGAGFDPETQTLYVPSITLPSVFSVKQGRGSEPSKKPLASKEVPEFEYVTDKSQPQMLPDGAWSAEGLPLVKPPYSRITAFDMNEGAIRWQVANGFGPRNHPQLAHLDLPPLGSGAPTCVLVTKTLVIAAGGGDVWLAGIGDPVVRAYDKMTGEVVGEIALPARVQGCPMTYAVDGKQYLALPTGDHDASPKLVVLALPPPAEP